MPSYCAVSTCRRHGPSPKSDESKPDVETSLSFFSFPKNTELRDKWIKACGREDSFNPNTSRICSEHFRNIDFVRDLKAELLGYDPRRRSLKKGSIPSINVSLEFEELRMCSRDLCEHSCEFCRPPATKIVEPTTKKVESATKNKFTNTTPYKCLSCFLLKRESNFCKKRMKPLLSYTKIAECRLHVMRKKIARIETENKVLRRQLRQYKNSESGPLLKKIKT